MKTKTKTQTRKMKTKTLKHTDGREISLDMNANTIPKLENQLMLLGMNGLAYSDIWNKIAKKLNKLKENLENEKN